MEIVEIKKFELKSKIGEHGELLLTNYDGLKDYLDILDSKTENVVVDESNYKETKKTRAAINNALKEITSLKSSHIKDYLYDYINKSDTLSKQLKSINSRIDESVKHYEDENDLSKPKVITVVFKTYDQNLANQIIELGKTINIEGEIK